MKEPPKYEPFDNFIVPDNVQSLPGFNFFQLRNAIADIIDSEKSGWHLEAGRPMFFDLFGACLAMAFDGDELVYDLGASAPSSPLGFLTVMLASEAPTG